MIATKLGIIYNVKKVETSSPNKITFANGAHISDCPPIPNAKGTSPEMVVNEVRIIGRNLNLPAWIILLQCWKGERLPSSLLLFIKVIKIIASFTTIPASATKPNIETILKGFPEINSPSIDPIIANGTVVRIINGWV